MQVLAASSSPRSKHLLNWNVLAVSANGLHDGLRGVGFSRANLFGRRFESYSGEAQCPFIA